SNIKSVQRGSYTFGGAEDTAWVTISAVNLSNAIIKISIQNVAAGNTANNSLQVKGKFTSTTQIELKRQYAGGSTYTKVFWEVIEFNNVKSLQSGDVAINTNPKTITISSVNTSKSVMFSSYLTTAGSTTAHIEVGYNLDSATQISFNCQAGDNTAHWFVVEFN
ncbi:MAG: hypothetical protein ACOZCL_08425, partial [Bacillota bacterium]